jgi:hypothetical protein
MQRALWKIAPFAIVMSMTTVGTALAAPSEAQERFEEGRALLKAGRPADAIPRFVASIAAEPTLAALLNLADCYERIGKLASAHARFRQAQELAKSKDAVRSDEARKRAEILEPRLSTITLLPPARPQGVRVWVDGIEVPSSEWGTPRPYDAGPHEVVSQDRRGVRHTAIADVPATDAARVTAPIVDAPETSDAKPPVAPIGPAPASTSETESRPLGTAGLVSGGVGVAVLATGIVTGIIALGAKSDLKDGCPSYPRCPADKRGELVDLDDRARTFGTVSTITVIVGSALVVAGVVMYLVAPARRASSNASAAFTRGWTSATW